MKGWHRGEKQSKEHIKKRAKARKGKKFTPEQRREQSERIRLWWLKRKNVVKFTPKVLINKFYCQICAILTDDTHSKTLTVKRENVVIIIKVCPSCYKKKNGV